MKCFAFFSEFEFESAIGSDNSRLLSLEFTSILILLCYETKPRLFNYSL